MVLPCPGEPHISRAASSVGVVYRYSGPNTGSNPGGYIFFLFPDYFLRCSTCRVGTRASFPWTCGSFSIVRSLSHANLELVCTVTVRKYDIQSGSEILPFQIRTHLKSNQKVRISDPMENPDHLKSNLFLTIQNLN